MNLLRCFALAVVIIACAGCSKHRYPVSGMILRIDPSAQTLLVSHGPIPGYMGAMAMPFHVRDPKLLSGLQPGMHIEFQLVVGKNDSYVEQIRLPGGVQFEADASLPAPAPSDQVSVGQPVPDFQLTDQANRTVKLSDFGGKVVAVTFIYTRCPLPDYCPRLSSNFARLQERFRDRLGHDLVLFSVTFDPQYDQPEVLAKYAKQWKANPECWRFLTGPAPEIRRVCGQFGVEFWPDQGQITHSMRTAIVDRQGRLAVNLNGRDFTPEELGDLVESVLER